MTEFLGGEVDCGNRHLRDNPCMGSVAIIFISSKLGSMSNVGGVVGRVSGCGCTIVSLAAEILEVSLFALGEAISNNVAGTARKTTVDGMQD